MKQKIYEKKHSSLIRDDVMRLVELKKKYFRLEKTNPGEFEKICITRCIFLFNNYTDIFNKIKKNEIDLSILTKFLDVLKLIEDKKIDQHEGSFKIGKYLKEMYIDSALKKSEKLDKKYGNKEKEVKTKEYILKQYKEQNLID